MNRFLAPLQSCSDLYAVKTRLQSVCERFGTVVRLDVVSADQGGRRRALCFVQMSTADEEQHVMGALGIGRFGGDLVVLVELEPLEPPATPLEMAWSGISGAGVVPSASSPEPQ